MVELFYLFWSKQNFLRDEFSEIQKLVLSPHQSTLLVQSTGPRLAAHRWKTLENRITNMLFKQLTCIGLIAEREVGEYVRLSCYSLRHRSSYTACSTVAMQNEQLSILMSEDPSSKQANRDSVPKARS